MVQQRPVGKEPGIARYHLAHPVLCPAPMSPQAFVFRHRPACKTPIQIAQRRIKCRLVVATIVRKPTTNNRVEHACQVIYPFVYTTAQLPFANRLTDGTRCRSADTGTEVDEVLTPPILRSSRLKHVPKKIELLLRVVPTPVIIFAVDDLRLLRMKLQSALSKTAFESNSEEFSLLLTDTVAESIIGETFKGDVGIMLRHPAVERVMKKEVGQQG